MALPHFALFQCWYLY